ncbi:MAG TPA: LysR substrate-binding domain-containing protein [Variovorax sp.]
MDIRFLETFVLVAQLGSIAEAARRQGLTPASVAQRLAVLEADIGGKLVTRSGRTVSPTEAGLRVLERAQSVLREVRDLRSAASHTSLPAGPLRLGATPTAMSGMLPAMLKQWVALHPSIAIYIEPGSTTALHARVIEGELDAAVLVRASFELPKSAAWHTLRQEPLVLVAPADLRVRDPLRTLAQEPYIRYDRNVIGGRMADEYLRRKKVLPQVRFELDGIENIARLVAERLGVSVLPDWPSAGEMAQSVRRWELPQPCPSRTVGVLWLRSQVRSALVREFVRLTDRALP